MRSQNPCPVESRRDFLLRFQKRIIKACAEWTGANTPTTIFGKLLLLSAYAPLEYANIAIRLNRQRLGTARIHEPQTEYPLPRSSAEQGLLLLPPESCSNT